MRRLLLLTVLLWPFVASAQEGWPGEFRVEGYDSSGDLYTAELSIERDGGGWAVARTVTYWQDEDRYAEHTTWVATRVEKVGDRRLRVTFGGTGAGISAALGTAAEADASQDLKAPVSGHYYLATDGRLREWLRTEKPVGGKKGWRWALGLGPRDYPSLRLEREAKFEDLLGDALKRYEASGVTHVGGELAVVFDNAPDVALVGEELIPELSEFYDGDGKGASDFEGVTYDAVRERYFVIVEADKHGGDLAPRLWELRSDLSLKRKVWLPYEPPSRGKGFEGLLHVRRDGKEYLLGLLEGNHGKSDERSVDRGHGKIVVFERKSAKKWKREATIDLPEGALFSDFSGLDLLGDRLAVVSQTSSLLWLGTLSPDSWTLEGEGRVYRFPREGSVAVYASVEGVAWLPDGRLVVVSDRYHGEVEPCEAKDESIHLFSLPD